MCSQLNERSRFLVAVILHRVKGRFKTHLQAGRPVVVVEMQNLSHAMLPCWVQPSRARPADGVEKLTEKSRDLVVCDFFEASLKLLY